MIYNGIAQSNLFRPRKVNLFKMSMRLNNCPCNALKSKSIRNVYFSVKKVLVALQKNLKNIFHYGRPE
jgi:hypothetical protein